jgi:hypothetical protein
MKTMKNKVEYEDHYTLYRFDVSGGTLLTVTHFPLIYYSSCLHRRWHDENLNLTHLYRWNPNQAKVSIIATGATNSPLLILKNLLTKELADSGVTMYNKVWDLARTTNFKAYYQANKVLLSQRMKTYKANHRLEWNAYQAAQARLRNQTPEGKAKSKALYEAKKNDPKYIARRKAYYQRKKAEKQQKENGNL